METGDAPIRPNPLGPPAGETRGATHSDGGSPASPDRSRGDDRRFRALAAAVGGVFYQMSPDWSEMQPLDGRGLVASNTAPIRDWLERNIPESEHAAIRERIARCVADTSAFEMEHRVYRPDRSIGWTHSRAVPILDDAGRIIEWIGSATDITERKKAEEQLRRSRDTFYHLIQDNPFGVYLVDADFRLAQVSRGAEKVFAHVPRPLLGRDFAEVLRSVWSEPFAGEAIGRFRHTLDTGEPYVAVRTVERRNDVEAVEAYDWRIERIALPDDRFGVVCYFYDLSERQRWEAALRESEERFRLMADAVPQIVWITDGTGRAEFFNQQWFKYTGTAEQPASAGETSANFLHPDDQAATMEAFDAARRAGTTFAVEHRIRSASGEYRWFLVRGEPHRDDATGEITRWFGASVDIHDRRTAEDARRRGEFRWQRLIEQSPLSIQIFAPDGTVRQVNRAWERLWGITLDDVPGYNIRLDPQLREFGMADRFERAFAGEAVTIDPVPYVLDRGEYAGVARWVGAYVYPVKDEAGRVDEVVLVHEDVTEQRDAEEALRVSERQMRLLADSLPALLGYIDSELRYRLTNRAYFDWYGRPPAEMAGMRVRDAMGEEAFAVREPYMLAALRGETVRFEVTSRHAVRGSVECEALYVPDVDEGGRVRGFVALVQDISDRKRTEATRERLHEAERNARAEAERASRMKDEFLATLSHELRTPLSSILGWSQILRRSNKPQDLAQGLETIERNARAQSRIIEDLLDMSRIISGKLVLDARPTDLNEVLAAALETARPAAAAKGIALVGDAAASAGGEPHPVLADANRLQQVFWNLLTNAVKFTPAGGVVATRVSRHESLWRVDVIDSGEGIDATFLPHVFDRFRQADASTTRRHGGLGLGLSIVKQLVELHGGRVSVESEGRGRGTTFSVFLPIGTPPHDDPRGPHLRGPGGPAAGTTPHDGPGAHASLSREELRGVRVVIADDEPDARELARRLLADCGAIVFVAASAGEAVALVERERPDVLISDIGMPGEDGYSLLRRVRALGSTRGGDVAAVALTAYARAKDRVRALRAGFQMHVPKPVEPAELTAAVAAVVAKR